VLAPLLMLGAGLGVVIASVIPGSDPTLWPLVCMAAVLAGVLGAPLTSAIFALGLTGNFNALLPLLLATGVSYGFTVLVMPRSIMTEKIARRGLHIYREYSVDPQERAFVDEVMSTEVVTIPVALSLGDSAEKFFGSAQRHRSFPVVNEEGVLIGMLDRDALAAGLRGAGESAPVSSILDSVPPVVALPTETCQAAGRRMAVKKLERLPVVADGKSLRLIGIVSRSDLIKPAHDVFHEEHVRERLFGN
jgi:CBS domain-containing protein